MSDRLINIAKDKNTGEILNANELFDNKKTHSFEIRKEFNEGKIKPICLECEQELTISHSKFDRLFFRHLPNHSSCILSNNSLTPKEQKEYFEILKIRESDRHKSLKNKIGNLLLTVKGIDKNSINIDNKFIIKNGERRKPDVYCKYKEFEIVFEIQLSKLPLWYILRRHNFYKENNIYLVWILDNFNVRNAGSFERDIKYLNNYQNFFTLNENSSSLKLNCEYKKVYIENKTVKSHWKIKSISLDKLTFNQADLQVYYYDFTKNLETKESELTQLLKLEEEDRWNKEQERLEKFRKEKIQKIIFKIAEEKKKNFGHFNQISNEISNFNFLEIKELNELLKINKSKKSAIIKWIKETNEKNQSFLYFILETSKIELDVNKTDNDNRTAFIELYSNDNNIYKIGICKLLFQRNYILAQNDFNYINSLPKKKDFDLIIILNRISNRKLVEEAYKNDSILFILESAKFNKIVGSKLNSWITFANNAIQFYGHFWEYIELAFKKYKIWDKIISEDINGTFEAKLINLYQNYPTQNYNIDEIVRDLYPEIYE